jgi:hypothetical protein
MRTTLDLPDPLMRELKARAALEGVKLKDYFAKIAQTALQRPIATDAAPKRSPVPVFRRTNAKPMPAMSNAQLYAAMDAQDAARHATR